MKLNNNLTLEGETGSKRIKLECDHQKGILYMVPAEGNWVCSDSLMHVHALAGFFGQLTKLNEPIVTELMQRWGLYYREVDLGNSVTEGN